MCMNGLQMLSFCEFDTTRNFSCADKLLTDIFLFRCKWPGSRIDFAEVPLSPT